MKKVIFLLLTIIAVLSMSLTVFAADNQTEISLTLDENMESYELVIPATVSIDPAVKAGKVDVKIQDINLVWNKGINLYVKAKNTDVSGATSSYLINTEDVSKKIAYRIHLGNNIVYNATERAYDEEIGLLTNTYEYNEYTSSWARHAEEINLVIEGDYPGSGTYTDMLTFSVELYQ